MGSQSTQIAADGADGVDDARLLKAAAQGSTAAFTKLVGQYQDLIYRIVWRLSNGHADAEDITQEVFLRLWKNPGQIREAGALKGWLVRVASNLVMDKYRARPLQDIDQVGELEDGRPTAEDSLALSWSAKRIDAAIAALPDRQKLALSLVHFEQLGNGEAAEIMEVSVDALESLLARARRNLKTALQGDKELLLASIANEG